MIRLVPLNNNNNKHREHVYRVCSDVIQHLIDYYQKSTENNCYTAERIKFLLWQDITHDNDILQLINDNCDTDTASTTYFRTIHERVTATAHRILNLIYAKAKEENEKEKRGPMPIQTWNDLPSSIAVHRVIREPKLLPTLPLLPIGKRINL